MVVLFKAAVAATAFATSVSAAFSITSKNNVATYWGQGPNQARLLTTCQNTNVDVINVAFIDVFPDQGPGGWPGSNFGNQCGSEVFQNNGTNTDLLSNCPTIGPDIISCQQTYGKKILLSIGGGYPTNYYIKSTGSAQYFAQFLWSAFGPVSANNGSIPRPFGNAVVDGFDFDIESYISPAPIPNYQSNGYADMISYLRNSLYPQDKSKTYYISGSPQCVLPDSHLSSVIANVYFDWILVQFYNTPQCSARAGVNHLNGNKTYDISFSGWCGAASKNPNIMIYLGIPGSPAGATDPSYYLPPGTLLPLVKEFYAAKKKFGGIMIWEATYLANNKICGMTYAAWMKKVLNAAANNTPLNPNPATCKAPTSRRWLPSSMWF